MITFIYFLVLTVFIEHLEKGLSSLLFFVFLVIAVLLDLFLESYISKRNKKQIEVDDAGF